MSSARTSGPISTFARLWGGHVCECCNQRTASNFRILVELWI